jgi:hypothetical protein
MIGYPFGYLIQPTNRLSSPAILSGLVLWLGADNYILDNNPPVSASQWTDQSGQNRHAQQPVKNQQPTTTTLNGRTILFFDGANDLMDLNAAGRQALNGAPGFCISFLARLQSNDRRIIHFSNNSGVAIQNTRVLIYQHVSGKAGAVVQKGDGTSPSFLLSGSDFVVNTYTVWTVNYNANTSILEFYKDGVSDVVHNNVGGPGTTFANTDSQLAIVGMTTVFTNPWHGEIAEIVMYNQSKTPTEISKIYNYFKFKYSL